MVGQQHQLDGDEFEQASEVGDGQGSLACCSPWGCKESDMTEQLNGTDDFECMCACVIDRVSEREERESVWGKKGDVIFLVSSASKVLFLFNTFSYWSISPFLWFVFVLYYCR